MSRRQRSKVAAFLANGHTRAEAVDFFELPLATVKEIEVIEASARERRQDPEARP